MANRSYTNRQDFRQGWNVSVNRYALPGSIGNMVNAMLDPLAHGALRQSYGVDFFAHTGTTNEWTDSDAVGRYPGICHLSRLKESDYGNYDEICVGVMRTVGSTTSAHFYLLAAPDTTTVKMNFPWGKTFSITLPYSMRYTVYPYDWCWMLNETEAHNNITITKVGAATSASVAGVTDGGVIVTGGASPAPNETVTLKFTHNDTAEVATCSLVITYTASTATVLPAVWMQTFEGWHAFQMYTGTYRIQSTGIGHDRLPEYPITSIDTSSAANFGQFLYVYGDGIVIARSIYSQSPIGPPNTFTTLSQLETDFFFNTNSYCDQIAFTGGVTHTGKLYVYAKPPKAPASAAMKSIHTVNNVVQAETTPYGIWKSAGMNGFSYFYDGISTPFRLREEDPFEVSTTYSKTVGMSRPTPDVAVSNTTSVDGENNVEGIVRYFYAYLDAEYDEGPLTPFFPNSLSAGVGVYDSIGDLEGWDAGTGSRVQVDIGSVPATVTKVRLYRTMKDRGSPYFVTDVDRAAGTITIIDTVSDLDLGDLPFTHGDPPPTDLFSPVVYYDRIWGLGTRQGVADAKRTYLFWTDVNAPESFFWDGNYAAVYAEDGDEATALVRDRSGLIVFKNNHTYRMVGRNPEDITFVEVTVEDSDTGVGCPHPNAAVATDKGTFFYWNGGVYLYTDGGAVDISKPIAPLLKGNEKGWTITPDYYWSLHRGVDGNSVDLSFDPKHNRLFFSYEYLKPVGYPNENKDGQTLIFDANNGIWCGQMDAPFQFIRRYNVPVVSSWDLNNLGLGWGDTLLCNCRTRRDQRALLPSNDEGLQRPAHLLRMGSDIIGETRVMPQENYVQFRPIVGNLGPYSSKRFLWVDYLADSVRPLNYNAAGKIVSTMYLDGSTTGDKDELPITSGHIYADRLRHVFGSVGAEVEPKVDLKCTSQYTEIIRLFEYSITWQNLGKDKASVQQADLSSGGGSPFGPI